jgi:hypothetical protein
MPRIVILSRLVLLATTILGGLHGVVLTIRLFFDPDERGFAPAMLIGCGLAAYVYVTAAGILYWRNPNHSKPLFWGLAIQVPWVSIPGVVYKFGVGLSWAVALVANHTGDKYSAGFYSGWQLGSSWELRLLQDAPLQVG